MDRNYILWFDLGDRCCEAESRWSEPGNDLWGIYVTTVSFIRRQLNIEIFLSNNISEYFQHWLRLVPSICTINNFRSWTPVISEHSAVLRYTHYDCFMFICQETISSIFVAIFTSFSSWYFILDIYGYYQANLYFQHTLSLLL